jgi:hypothetical protein
VVLDDYFVVVQAALVDQAVVLDKWDVVGVDLSQVE